MVPAERGLAASGFTRASAPSSSCIGVPLSRPLGDIAARYVGAAGSRGADAVIHRLGQHDYSYGEDRAGGGRENYGERVSHQTGTGSISVGTAVMWDQGEGRKAASRGWPEESRRLRRCGRPWLFAKDDAERKQ